MNDALPYANFARVRKIGFSAERRNTWRPWRVDRKEIEFSTGDLPCAWHLMEGRIAKEMAALGLTGGWRAVRYSFSQDDGGGGGLPSSPIAASSP